MFEDSEFGEDEIGRVSKVAGPGKLKSPCPLCDSPTCFLFTVVIASNMHGAAMYEVVIGRKHSRAIRVGLSIRFLRSESVTSSLSERLSSSRASVLPSRSCFDWSRHRMLIVARTWVGVRGDLGTDSRRPCHSDWNFALGRTRTR